MLSLIIQLKEEDTVHCFSDRHFAGSSYQICLLFVSLKLRKSQSDINQLSAGLENMRQISEHFSFEKEKKKKRFSGLQKKNSLRIWELGASVRRVFSTFDKY